MLCWLSSCTQNTALQTQDPFMGGVFPLENKHKELWHVSGGSGGGGSLLVKPVSKTESPLKRWFSFSGIWPAVSVSLIDSTGRLWEFVLILLLWKSTSWSPPSIYMPAASFFPLSSISCNFHLQPAWHNWHIGSGLQDCQLEALDQWNQLWQMWLFTRK